MVFNIFVDSQSIEHAAILGWNGLAVGGGLFERGLAQLRVLSLRARGRIGDISRGLADPATRTCLLRLSRIRLQLDGQRTSRGSINRHWRLIEIWVSPSPDRRLLLRLRGSQLGLKLLELA